MLDLQEGSIVIPTAEQGNLLKGIDNKTVRRLEIEPIRRVFTYVLFSVTHFLQGNQMVRDCIFYKCNFF